MRASRNDLPIVTEMPEGTVRQINWGGMTVEVGDIRQDIDGAPLFKGLPDDRCLCPHWGYVLKGRMCYKFSDHEEVHSVGEAYYAPPGHIPLLDAGCEYVEFSPTDELTKTMQVVERNMKK